MSETLQTSFHNTGAKGRITLFKNYFDGGKVIPGCGGTSGLFLPV